MGYVGMWVDLGDGPKESVYKSRGRKEGGGARRVKWSEEDGGLLEPSLVGSTQEPRPVISIPLFPLSPPFPFSPFPSLPLINSRHTVLLATTRYILSQLSCVQLVHCGKLINVWTLRLVSPLSTPLGIYESESLVSLIWAGRDTGKSKLAPPVKIELKEGAGPVRIKQYPIKPEVRQGIKKLIDNFLEYKILEECESKYNTPILPVRKTLGEYRLVQDLRAVNQIVKDIYPVVANP